MKKIFRSTDDYIDSLAGNTYKLIILASVLISLAVLLTGTVNYVSTKNALISKAKSEDLVFIVKSMSEKIDGRIERAMETSFLMARDPVNIEWLGGAEQDVKLGKTVLERLNDIAVSYDYNSTFIAGVKTKHYYYKENRTGTKGGPEELILSEKNPADVWFFNTIAAGKTISLNVDYNRGMNDTFLFVNTIMRSAAEPVGVTGVALSLRDIAREFQQYKVGRLSSLWMVDDKGTIQLADNLQQRGRPLGELVPAEVIKQIKKNLQEAKSDVTVSQYTESNGEIVDYAFQRLKSSDWVLFYQIPRKENIAVINSLKTSTFFTILMLLIFFVIIFFIISRKVANPLKQTMLLNMELERKVNERTLELQEMHHQVMDSIDYAKRMQEAILPSVNELNMAFQEHFVIWKPKDVVGGDFYWVREVDDTRIVAVGDCTGHGVPGALMAMTVNAILYHLVTNVSKDNPEIIIRELNRLLKQSLNKNAGVQFVDDGLDIAICCIKNKSQMLYAGAKIDLLVHTKQGLQVFKAYKRSIGYKDSKLSDDFTNAVINITEGDTFILATDGYSHQNGGDKDFPLGTKRFYHIMQKGGSLSFPAMKEHVENSLAGYMGNQPQRDDITIMVFRVR